MGTAYFQGFDGGPSLVAGKPYEQHIISDEQPYQRWLKVGSEWEQLNFSWVKSVPSLVVIECQDGTLEVGRDGAAFAEVAAGRDARFAPRGVLFVKGPAKYTLTVFPG